MLDNGSFNYFGVTETETEQEQAQTAVYGEIQPQIDTQVDTGTYDDYSMTANYTEQRSYESDTANFEEQESSEEQVATYTTGFQFHDIQKEEQEVVNLIKTRQKIALSGRMKIVATMFSVIMAALMFLIVFNFASVGAINSAISDRQFTVNELNVRINELQSQYNELSDDDNFYRNAVDNNYVRPDESNTVHMSSSDLYEEETIEKLPSNWFNDFCNFLSRLFH